MEDNKQPSEGLSPADWVRLLEIQQAVAGIDLEALERDRLAAMSPREALVAKARAGGSLTRATKKAATKRKPGRPKKHWKAKAKRYREYHRVYQLNRYHEILKPRRNRESLLALENGDWYGFLVPGWKLNKTKFTLTKEEWDRCVAGRIGEGRVPVITRYTAKEPVSLYNMVVRDSDTRATLYDGKEQKLLDLGYTVES